VKVYKSKTKMVKLISNQIYKVQIEYTVRKKDTILG